MLAKFQQGEDVYCALASQFFPYTVTREHKHERGIGKIAVLGCGYGMSAGRFSGYAIDNGVDLLAAGVTAEQVVEGFRDANAALAGYKLTGSNGFVWREGGLWKEVEQAVRAVIETGVPGTAGRCEFSYSDQSLCATLPSGRNFYYRNARLCNESTNGWSGRRKPSIVYDHPKYKDETTYGGKLVENLVQAICRDLLADSLVQCERENLPTVLHVHDEIVIEVPDADATSALNRLLEIMSTPPYWAEGFPIEAEGFISPRYSKSPPDGAVVVKARNGTLLTGR